MFESLGKESIEKLDQIVDKIPPIVRDIENRLLGGLHGVLDRIDCDCAFQFRFKINPMPKAKPDE